MPKINTETRHTAGAWTATGERYIGLMPAIVASLPDGRNLIIAHVDNVDDFDGRTDANASLIAAAPDLLAALHGLLDEVSNLSYDARVEFGGPDDSPVIVARAAIAKAGGAATPGSSITWEKADAAYESLKALGYENDVPGLNHDGLPLPRYLLVESDSNTGDVCITWHQSPDDAIAESLGSSDNWDCIGLWDVAAGRWYVGQAVYRGGFVAPEGGVA